jgi:hypothetical protein
MRTGKCLKQWSTWLASMRPWVQDPVPSKKRYWYEQNVFLDKTQKNRQQEQNETNGIASN